MNILLILAGDRLYRYRGITNDLMPYAPLTLATLAALVPAELNARVEIVDEGIQKPDYDSKNYDLVGISCVTSAANRAYELSDFWHKKGAFVVLGGAHPTLIPDEAQEHADAIVVGLAEETWPQLLRDFVNGGVKKRYHKQYTGELSSPVPRRDLYPRIGYMPGRTIIANNGCSNHCFFCVVNQSNYTRCCVRPIPEVVNEIKGLHSSSVMFLDPNLISNRDYAANLFQALIPLKRKWMAPIPSNVVNDPEIFDLMLRSGCEGVLIGFESFSQASLNRSGKKFNQVVRYKEIVERLHAWDISVLGCFVLGFDEDTPELLARTADIVSEIGVDLPRYALLTPFPGTGLFTHFRNQGRLITEDWSLYDSQHVVFRPKHMSPLQLQQIYNDTLQKSFSHWQIRKRVRLGSKKLILSLLANWSFRHIYLSAWKDEYCQALQIAGQYPYAGLPRCDVN